MKKSDEIQQRKRINELEKLRIPTGETRHERTVSNLRKMFSFNSERHWINKAKSLFASCGVPKSRYICLDVEGRVCVSGAEFNRATKEGTYPITVYEI